MTGSTTHTRNYSTSSATMNPSTLHIDGSAPVNEENLFDSLAGFDDLANDDNDEDLSLEYGGDDDAFAIGDGEDVKPAVKGKKGKLPPSTAEKKATHNAVERARRESLNARFLVLADMLPGMNHVKRASKAAIVNKSIDLIRTLRSVETKLAKENEALKEELNAIRQARLSGAAVLPTPTGTPGAQAGGNAGAQSSPGGGLPQMFGLPAMHPATAAASTAAGFPVLSGMGALPSHMQHQIHLAAAHQQAQAHAQAQAMVQQQQQQQQIANHHQRSASVSSSTTGGNGTQAPLPVFPGVFNGLFGGQQQQNNSSGSNAGNFLGSPADFGDFLGGAGTRNGSNSPDSASNNANSSSNANANAAAAAAYFEFLNASTVAANTTTSNRGDSPVSYNSPKDSSPNNAGSNNGSGAGTAPSPASSQSHSISTPVSNTYSPLPHTATFGGFGSNGTGAFKGGAGNGAVDGTSPPNPAIAAFDISSDPLFLATNFSNADIVKAQNDLSAFIAYQQQQRLNGGNSNGSNTPTTTFQNNPFASAFTAGFAGHHIPHGTPGPVHQQGPQFSTTQHVPNIPAWQLMMAQQQAITTAYGQSY